MHFDILLAKIIFYSSAVLETMGYLYYCMFVQSARVDFEYINRSNRPDAYTGLSHLDQVNLQTGLRSKLWH